MGRKPNIDGYDKKLEKIKLEIEAAEKVVEEKLMKYDELRKKRDAAIAREISAAIADGRIDYDDFKRLLDSSPQLRKRGRKSAR